MVLLLFFFVTQNRAVLCALAVLNRRAAARRNDNGKRVSLHAMKVYRENGSKAPRIPDIGIILVSVFSRDHVLHSKRSP
jgi:hypothetical protein